MGQRHSLRIRLRVRKDSMQQASSNRTPRNRVVNRRASAVVLLLITLLASQALWAAKHTPKGAQARVIYSGSFRGHVEPCG